MTQHPDEPVSITTARRSHSEDLRRRQGRYLLSMGIRTLCFLLAIVTSGPLRWTLVAGAVFLPYVAVVVANASDRRSAGPPASYLVVDRPLLETGRSSEDREP